MSGRAQLRLYRTPQGLQETLVWNDPMYWIASRLSAHRPHHRLDGRHFGVSPESLQHHSGGQVYQRNAGTVSSALSGNTGRIYRADQNSLVRMLGQRHPGTAKIRERLSRLCAPFPSSGALVSCHFRKDHQNRSPEFSFSVQIEVVAVWIRHPATSRTVVVKRVLSNEKRFRGRLDPGWSHTH
jgi:hypothetical protein